MTERIRVVVPYETAYAALKRAERELAHACKMVAAYAERDGDEYELDAAGDLRVMRERLGDFIDKWESL